MTDIKQEWIDAGATALVHHDVDWSASTASELAALFGYNELQGFTEAVLAAVLPLIAADLRAADYEWCDAADLIWKEEE